MLFNYKKKKKATASENCNFFILASFNIRMPFFVFYITALVPQLTNIPRLLTAYRIKFSFLITRFKRKIKLAYSPIPC